MFSKKYLKLYLLCISILIFISVLVIVLTPKKVFAREGNNINSIPTDWGQINANVYEAQQTTKQ